MKLQAILLLAATLVTPELRYFSASRPILGLPPAPAQACVIVDAPIFSQAAAGLADLRLYGNNTETPYIIRTPAPTQSTATPLRPLNLGLHGKQVTFDAVMPEGTYNDLTLEVTSQDFLATVTVFGSQNQASPTQTRLGSYTIFDLTRQRLGRSTILHLPDSNFRYLHLSIEGPLQPESVTGLTVNKLPSIQPTYQPVANSLTFTEKDRSTIAVVTIPAHVPVDRLVFHLGDIPSTFSREVQIAVEPITPRPLRDDADVPPTPTTFPGSLLRIHRTEEGHRLDEERLTIDAPATTYDTPTRWTVSIRNGDDAPLPIISIRLEMMERDLCFEAAADKRYLLYYGDSALPAPIYDYTTTFTPQSTLVKATLGPVQPNPNHQQRPDSRPLSEKHPAFLWAALLAVIALLGAVAFRARTPIPS